MSAESSCARLARLIRRRQRETQYSLALRMGLPRSYVSKAESRKFIKGASWRYVEKFCAAYRLDIVDFLLIAEAMDGKWRGETNGEAGAVPGERV